MGIETCHTKLSLVTVHLRVILAYRLADSGIRGKTLLGAVAIQVYLLRLEADVALKAEASFDEISRLTSANECHRARLDADNFMQIVSSASVDR